MPELDGYNHGILYILIFILSFVPASCPSPSARQSYHPSVSQAHDNIIQMHRRNMQHANINWSRCSASFGFSSSIRSMTSRKACRFESRVFLYFEMYSVRVSGPSKVGRPPPFLALPGTLPPSSSDTSMRSPRPCASKSSRKQPHRSQFISMCVYIYIYYMIKEISEESGLMRA